MWAGFVSILKAVPALLALIKGMFSIWANIKEAQEKKRDDKAIKDELDGVDNGGRPSAS